MNLSRQFRQLSTVNAKRKLRLKLNGLTPACLERNHLRDIYISSVKQFLRLRKSLAGLVLRASATRKLTGIIMRLSRLICRLAIRPGMNGKPSSSSNQRRTTNDE